MYKVTFKFEDETYVEAFALAGSNLLEVARKTNVAIDAPCSGNGSCGKCRVKLISGDLVSEESRHISVEDYYDGWRLACNSSIAGDVTVEVPDIASAYKNRMKTADLSTSEETRVFTETQNAIEKAGISKAADISAIRIKLSLPTLDDTMPDNERLSRALAAQTGVKDIVVPFRVLKELSDVLRKEDFDVKCVIGHEEGKIFVYDVLPGSSEAPVLGLAIDIGTTTVSAVIADIETGKITAKASSGNGQIRYGADVINRIIESSRPGGRERLRRAVTDETINPMIEEMCKDPKTDFSRIYRVCIAGNTTMNHLLFGVNADPVRMEPYIPTFFEVSNVTASDLRINVNPNARVVIAPNVGSYVGGDITAGALSSLIWNSDKMSLFIDLGTNGELVFGNSDLLMCCACSAGPAFEGGDISFGMRATDGAIEACTIDKETMLPSFTVIGETKPVGICGSGLIDLIAELFRCGIINAKGVFSREGDRIKHDEHGIGRYILAYREESGTGREVSINEIDLDNFIRAKGAIFSAIRIMLESLDFDVSVLERVIVAGGIGSGISIKNAISIGMLPDISVDLYSYIGNSSLSGAYAMLVSSQAEEKVTEIARSMTYLELSSNPKYMDEFIAACFLPHTDASLFPTSEQ